jgi:hypothetical protein
MSLKITLKLIISYLALGIFLISYPFFVSADGIRDTKHNLSISGPGPIRARSTPQPDSEMPEKKFGETQICIFCHTPHNAYPDWPLWNHAPSAAVTYTHYTSSTLQSYKSEADAPPIDGVSKLCLSCHDGTIAVGAVKSSFDDIAMEISQCIDASGKLTNGPGCTGYIGTDLSGGHPISIVFDSMLVARRNGNTELCQLNPPPTRQTEPYVRLYPTRGGYGVQCTSCHDPHTNRSMQLDKSGNKWPPFWQKESYDAVCLVCHADCTHTWPW